MFWGVQEKYSRLVKDRVKSTFTELTGLSADKAEKSEDSREPGEPIHRFGDVPGNFQVWEGEESEQVDVDEVKGVGFYYPRILVNDSEYEKADVRQGLWRLIRGLVRGLFR